MAHTIQIFVRILSITVLAFFANFLPVSMHHAAAQTMCTAPSPAGDTILIEEAPNGDLVCNTPANTIGSVATPLCISTTAAGPQEIRIGNFVAGFGCFSDPSTDPGTDSVTMGSGTCNPADASLCSGLTDNASQISFTRAELSSFGTITFTFGDSSNVVQSGSTINASTGGSAAPVVTIENVAVNENTGTATFTATLDTAVAGGFSVDVSTADNTATTADNDYTAVTSQTLTFSGTANEMQTFSVTITGDTTVEADEIVDISMSNLTGATGVDISDTATLTITNDDSATVTIADVSSTEDGGVTNLTVTLNNAVAGGLSVDVSTADNTATTADGDYAAVTNQTLTFAGTAGEAETFSVTLGGDSKVEADEIIDIAMSNLVAASVDVSDINITDTATLTITNDDSATVTIADVSGNEDDGAITVTVTVDNAVDGGFDVDVSTADGTATTADSDYTSVTNQTLTFSGTIGEAETFTVTPTADVTAESDETVTISMSSLLPTTVDASDINISDTASVTIFNDDAVPTLAIDDVSIAEGDAGSTTATFTVTRTGATSQAVSVDFASSDGTATAGNDYTATSGTLNFATNQMTQTFDVTIAGDATVEADETVTLTLTNPTNAIISDATGTLTITNDDTAAVTIGDVALNEDNGTATITLTLDNAVDGGFAVDVSTADGTSTTADSDYAAITNATETFAGTAGETETLTVTLGVDMKVEANETVTLSMSNLVPVTVDGADITITDTGTLTINNDDSATVTIADVSGNEDDGAITVTVTVDNAVDGGFDVDVSTADGTATTADSDYTSVTNQTLTFSGTIGEAETFTVTPTADVTAEPDETVTISMSSLLPTTVDGGDINILDTASVTILNDDTSPEINVQGGGDNIPNGDTTPIASDGTDIGDVALNASGSSTFTIQNLDAGTLNITSITSNTALFTVGSAPTSVAGSSSETFTVTFSPTNPADIGQNQGTITIVSNDADEPSYTFTVQGNAIMADQTITFNQPADVTFGNTASLTATASSSLPVTFTTNSTGICSISGTTLTAEGVGSCVINANQAGDASFAAAPQVTQTIMITQRDLTIQATQQSKTYGEAITLDDTAFTIADEGNIGDTTLPFGNVISTVNISSSGSLDASTDVDAVTFVDNLSISGVATSSGGFVAANYNITFINADFAVNTRAVTLTALQQNKDYGDIVTLDNTVFSVADEGNAGDTTLPNGETIDTVTISSLTGVAGSPTAVVSTFTNEILIQAPVTGSAGTGDGFAQSNYTFTFVNGDFAVNRRPVTLTASAQQKEFGTSITLDDTAFTVADKGNSGDTTLPNGETIQNVPLSSASGSDTNTAAPVSVLPNDIVIGTLTNANGQNGFNIDNYVITSVNGAFSIVDTTGPTVTSVNVPANDTFGIGEDLDFTVNFSENVTATGTPQLAITVGATVRQATLVSGSGGNALLFRYTVQAGDNDADGVTVGTLSANGGTLQDAIGNDANLALNSIGVTTGVLVDTTAPTVMITTSSGGSFNQSAPGSFTATVTFSEPVTGFSGGDLTASNANVGNLSPAGGSGTVFTATITPDAMGDVALNVAANVAQDAGNNNNTAATEVIITQTDDVAPTVAITTDSGGSFNQSTSSTFTATVTFSEPVTGFVNGELTASNATVSALNPAGGNGTVFTANITPDNTGDVALAVAAAVAQDAGNNNNTASPTVIVNQNDDVSPTVTIINAPATHDGMSPFAVTIEFSEDVVNFIQSDIAVNGQNSLGLFTAVDGNTYVLEILPMPGSDVTVDVAAAVAQDAAGNDNTAATQVTISDASDMDAPAVAITTPSDEHDSITPFVATVTFNEPVNGFEDGELTATNATVGALVNVGGGNTIFTATITPTSPLDIVLSVAANVATDAAGNMNTAAADLTITGTIIEQTQIVIANFMQNRANHILSNQPDIIDFVTRQNISGGGVAGNLALNATTANQVLAFSTSRSKILAGLEQARRQALGASAAIQSETVNDPLSVLANQASNFSENRSGFDPARLERGETRTRSYGFGGDDASLQTGAELIANQRQAADVAIDEEGNALAADRTGTWDVWTEIYGANSNSAASDSSFWVGYLGAHYFIDNDTLFGVLGQIDWADETNSEFNSRADGVGWLIGPYLAGQLPGQNLFYEARASWGTSDNDVSPIGTFTDSFDTTRFLASGKLSGSFAYDQYVITPEVSVSYFEDTQHNYTDSLGNLIPEQTVSLGEVRFGPDISQNIVLDDGTLLQPNIGISGVFNFGIAENAASQAFALGNDDFRARVDAGFSATNPTTGMIFTLEGFYDGIGIEDFDSYGGRARVTVPLN